MIIFLICAVLHDVFIPYILFDQFNFVKISIIVCLNKKIILINKFSKHRRVNIQFFDIKYLDLYLSLNFLSFILKYH
jgi:hypothetical protein